MMARDLHIVGASGQIGQGVAAKLGSYVPLTSVRLGHMGGLAEFPHSQTSEKSTLLVVAGPSTRDAVRGVSIDAYVSDLEALAMRYDHVVVASSVLVYIGRGSTPCLETDPVAASDDYRNLQLQKETVALKHHSGCVLRLSNVYGGAFAKNGIINDLIFKAKREKELKVFDGCLFRDFIHLSDVVRAICCIVENRSIGLFNLSTGIGTQISEIYRCIGDYHGCVVREEQLPNADVRKSCVASSARLTDATGWKPTIDVTTGLKRYLAEKQS